MPFTDKDLEKQKQAFRELKNTFEEFNRQQQVAIEAAGLSRDDICADLSTLSVEEQQLIQEMKQKAANEISAPKLNVASTSTRASASAAARRRGIRL